MTTASQSIPPRYLRTPEAARLLGLSERTLEKHRVYGTGPTFLKLGGRVVYAVDALTTWAEQASRTSTHDVGTGRIIPTTRRPVTPPRGTPL